LIDEQERASGHDTSLSLSHRSFVSDTDSSGKIQFRLASILAAVSGQSILLFTKAIARINKSKRRLPNGNQNVDKRRYYQRVETAINMTMA